MSTQTVPVAPEDSVEIGQVGGDLRIQGWDQADLQARGDGIRVEKLSGSIAVVCSGDLDLSLPRGVRLVVGRVGGDLSLENTSGSVELGLVGGDAILRNLSGSVKLTGRVGGDMHTENVSNFSMAQGDRTPDFDIHDRLRERIRERVERATQKAEAKIRKAEQKASQHAQFKHHFTATGRWSTEDIPSASRPVAQAEPVSEEERMIILRMLQDKKITSEQAEQLLSALEGKA